MEIQCRLTRFLPNFLTLLLLCSVPWGFMLSKLLHENASARWSVTACSIRHRIVSFKQQVRPILLKMNLTKPIFWGSFYTILPIPWMYHSAAVEELCTVVKTASKHCWGIKFKEQRDNEAKFKKKKITAEGFKEILAPGKTTLIDCVASFRPLEHKYGNFNLH